jgi:enterochelin esterase family protein
MNSSPLVSALRFSAFALCLLIPVITWSQQANVNLDWNPQKNTENLTPFSAPVNSPEVHDDRSVTFRVMAPQATKVRLESGPIFTALGKGRGDVILLTKGDRGVWSVTIGSLRPEMYAYHFRIDGAKVADPGNTQAAFTAMPPYSQLIVHGDGPAFYDARKVPHGKVTRHVYHSDVTHGERELYVYTPPGYDQSKRYPVLYLMGGSGEMAHNWIYDGRANFIMDNLLDDGKAVPMIIAIPNNQVLHRNHPQHVEHTFDLFEAEMRQHVIPLVDREYSTVATPHGRALSGLSMGGRHTMFVGFNSLDLFASFGVLSAGDTDAGESLKAFLNRPNVNDMVDYLFVGQGGAEASGFFNARVSGLVNALKAHDIKHDYYVAGDSGHDWSTWRRLLCERFLPNLWRNQSN